MKNVCLIIISILIHFQALKFLQLPRNSAIFQFNQIHPQKTFVWNVSTFLKIVTILTHSMGPKMTKIVRK